MRRALEIDAGGRCARVGGSAVRVLHACALVCVRGDIRGGRIEKTLQSKNRRNCATSAASA